MEHETESLEIRSADEARRRAATAQARAARLVVVWPPDLEGIIALGDDALELGRDRLAHGSVSRRHIVVAWQGGRHRVHDAGSKNGSWLDGAALDEAPRELVDGAVVRLGGVIAVYESGVSAFDEPTEGPLAQAIPGRSKAAAALRQAVQRAAGDPSPALILGETGVGKERVAAELHRLSKRSGPFVAVNVAELSERLVESQLFGHVRGAFTGADSAQPGLFRSADRGTLLLDEIGELPLDLQAKLLRAIQEREVRPTGATKAEKIDVRVIAATHVDLPAAVEAGTFRRDLWARLSLWELRVPPLAARRADILDFTRRLHERWRKERGLREAPLLFDPEAAEQLLLRRLPENLRSLDRLVHRVDPTLPKVTVAIVDDALGPASGAGAKGAGSGAAGNGGSGNGSGEASAASGPLPPPPTSAEELQKALDEQGSVHALARYYGKDRRQIYRWLEAFGMKQRR